MFNFISSLPHQNENKRMSLNTKPYLYSHCFQQSVFALLQLRGFEESPTNHWLSTILVHFLVDYHEDQGHGHDGPGFVPLLQHHSFLADCSPTWGNLFLCCWFDSVQFYWLSSHLGHCLGNSSLHLANGLLSPMRTLLGFAVCTPLFYSQQELSLLLVYFHQ